MAKIKPIVAESQKSVKESILELSKCDVEINAAELMMLRVLNSLFQFERIKRPYGLMHLLLFLYTPVGLCLIVIRLTLITILSFVLPLFLSSDQLARSITGVSILLGTITIIKGEKNLDRANPPPLIVSNHVSEFDAVAIRKLMPMNTLGYDFYKNMFLMKLLRGKSGMIFVPKRSRSEGGSAGRDKVRKVVQEAIDRAERPVMAFPEGGLTNGRVGLLQYHKFLFSLNKPVQAIALRPSDGPFPVNINDETSTFRANFFWYLFIPWHTFTLQILPLMSRLDNEEPIDFAHRVMTKTAEALNQRPTPFLYRDKILFIKQKKYLSADAEAKVILENLAGKKKPGVRRRTRNSSITLLNNGVQKFFEKKKKVNKKGVRLSTDNDTDWISDAFSAQIRQTGSSLGSNLSKIPEDLYAQDIESQTNNGCNVDGNFVASLDL